MIKDLNVQRNQDALLVLHKQINSKFHACFELGYPWQIFPDDMDGYNQLVNHREVLPQEVIFDFDTPVEKTRDYYYNIVKNKLISKGVSFRSWKTGGKGIHIHIIFPELLKLSVEHRQLMKESIIDYFFTYSSGERFSHHAKVDYQLCGRHMIRAEYGRHEKTGNFKLPFEANSSPLDNKIPVKVWKMYELKKNKPKVERKSTPYYMRDGKLPVRFKAIEYMLSEDFACYEDGRKRALQILCSYFYSEQGLKGLDIILEWNDYKLNRYFTEDAVKRQFSSIAKMVDSGKRYGLRSIQQLMQELGIDADKYMET